MQQPNPFSTLYVTERLSAEKFPELFSPVLIPSAMGIFEPGNVVVQGTQGTGKSMLLTLLRSDIRVEFERGNTPYPLPKDNNFLTVGINLATNHALRSVGRWSKTDTHIANQSDLTSAFTDYVNCWLLKELFESFSNKFLLDSQFWKTIAGKRELDNRFFKRITRASSLEAVVSENGLSPTISVLTERLKAYLAYFNGRHASLSAEIIESQTSPLGRPISEAVCLLRECECLCKSTELFVVIDQFEQLLEMESNLPGKPYSLLTGVIDEAIHRRDPTLNFRLGTRPYAWKPRFCEELRDFRLLNLDAILARKENQKHPIFPRLARDVFDRRVNTFGLSSLLGKRNGAKKFFGASPTPTDRVKLSNAKPKAKRLLQIPDHCPSDIRDYLLNLANQDLLSAKLGVAWYIQKYNKDQRSNIRGENVANSEVRTLQRSIAKGVSPWDGKAWWKKERMWLATLQLSAANAQRSLFFGERDVIQLSGANILVFTSICYHVWNNWQRLDGTKDAWCLPVPYRTQDEGIRDASNGWHAKIVAEPWIGQSLVAFLDVVGNSLRNQLQSDVAMSYPGGNGFSLAESDLLNATSQVRRILNEAVGRGYVLQRKHTPKSSTRGESKKWYPHPILAPYYGITAVQTKEPLYIRTSVIMEWLGKAGILEAGKSASNSALQLKLPGFEESTDEQS